MRRDPRLILKYIDFRAEEFDLHHRRAMADTSVDQALSGDLIEDAALWSAIADARILWARALRLSAAERETLLMMRGVKRG